MRDKDPYASLARLSAEHRPDAGEFLDSHEKNKWPCSFDCWSYFGAAVIGVIAFFVTCPAYILDPSYLEWVYPHMSPSYYSGDYHTHYLGWLFLRHSPWSFPLGDISNYVAPLPTYIAYTDSIPLAAFPFRLISDLLPRDFQYLGMWTLLSFILQGIFALRLIRPWIKDPVCKIIAVTLLTFSPILIFRTAHVALMSHWLLLWSIAVVQENLLKLNSQGQTSTPIITPVIIISLATLTQPYLAAMVAGICWAMPFGQFLADWKSVHEKKILLFVRLGLVTVSYMGSMAVILYSFGFLNGPSGTGGFHFFGTDVFSFFNNYGTSSFIPKFRNRKGLYEGYAWFGLGGWILIIACLIPRIRREIFGWFKHPYVKALLISLALMWFFALSGNIHFFGFWIIDMEWFWKPFGFITSALRTSGRFIWPLYYTILLSAAAVVANRYSKSTARILFVGALIAQCIDLGPWMANRSSRFVIQRGPTLKDPFWADATSKYRKIKMIPPQQDVGNCVESTGSHFYEWVEFAELAAKNKMSINSGYLARYDRIISSLYCRAEFYEFLAGPLHPDSLYIVRSEFKDHLPITGSDRECNSYDGKIACVARMTN